MRYFLSFLQILRPLNMILCCISVIIASYLSGNILSPFLLHVIIIVLCFAGASNIFNDILDINIDKINRPSRVLPSGKIQLFEATLLMSFLYGIGIISTTFIQPLGQKIALMLVLPILILYTPFFKRIPLIGNFIIGSILGLVFIFTEAALINVVDTMWFPFLLASGLSIIRELCKDGEDIIGDTASNINTFPKVFGLVPTVWLLRLFSVLLSLISIIPIINGQYGSFYLMTLIFGVHIPLFYSVFILLNDKSSSLDFSRVAKILKSITIIGIFVIFTSGF